MSAAAGEVHVSLGLQGVECADLAGDVVRASMSGLLAEAVAESPERA